MNAVLTNIRIIECKYDRLLIYTAVSKKRSHLNKNETKPNRDRLASINT